MQKTIKFSISLTTCSILLLMISGCSQNSPVPLTPEYTATAEPSFTPIETSTDLPTPAETPTNTLSYIDIMPRSWNRSAHFNWKHDGYPYESEQVIVFSDDSNTAIKERFALETEKALERILTDFEIGKEGRSVPINPPKIEVFISSRRLDKVDWEGFAHYGGFLLVYDVEFYRHRMTTFPDQFPYTYLITHELTHVIVLRILGNKQSPTRPIPEWFDEGLATFMGIPPLPIRTLQLYEIALRDKKSSFGFYYYTLNELMVYYLIKTYGMENVVGILFDMKEKNMTFEESFENRTGMATRNYEQNFDSLVRDFLPTE